MSTQIADLFGEFTKSIAGKSPLDLLDNIPSIPTPIKKPPQKRKTPKRKKYIPSYVKYANTKTGNNYRKRTQIYRINCGTIIYIFTSRTRAKVKANYLDRDIKTIICLDYFLTLRSGFILKLDGIKPKFVKINPDGSVTIQLSKKKNVTNNRHPISYTPSQLIDRRLQVKDDYVKTINGLSKNPDAIEYILRQLGIKYNGLELLRLQAIIRDTFPQEFGENDIIEAYNHIYIQRTRIAKIKNRRKQYYK